MGLSRSDVGSLFSILPDYLVKGAKIVYENGGIPEFGFELMSNTMGEYIHPRRLIAIIMEDGYYIELTELVSAYYDFVYYLPYLYQKLVREGRR
jgi:hypothetical protein